jgi:LacI family transcriptional regulator
MSRRRRIALLIESSRAIGRDLLCGIADYARTYGPWTFYHEERSLGDPIPAKLRSWGPEGVLARVEAASQVRQLRALGVPVVGLSHQDDARGLPSVIVDPDAIVRLAVDHLWQCGLRQFAYCGFDGFAFSDQRRRLFAEYLNGLGCEAHMFDGRRQTRPARLASTEVRAQRDLARLVGWLQGLPKPVGLVACNDMRAYQVLTACGEAGIAVPDRVAVIGVDNDPVQCALCDPPLSSIDSNGRKVGYEAAALLDRLVAGQGVQRKLVLIEPLGVVARQSTDVLAVSDREFVEIARYVREHAHQGLTVAELVRHTSLSRSTLERRFAANLGHSVNAEIDRVKLERVRELLLSTDLPLGEVARLAGFTHVETMHRLFKKATGQTPGQCRSARQVGATGRQM